MGSICLCPRWRMCWRACQNSANQDGLLLPLEPHHKASPAGWSTHLLGGYCEMDLGKGVVVLPAGHMTPGLSVSKNICGTRVQWVGHSGYLPNNLGFPAVWIKSLLCLSTCGCVIWSLLLCHERNFLREVFWAFSSALVQVQPSWLFCVSKVLVFMIPLCGDVPYED